MNKIKDFLYDASDILLGIAIVASIVLIVGWKLNDSMNIGGNYNFNSTNGNSVSQPQQTPVAKPSGDSATPPTTTPPVITDPGAVGPGATLEVKTVEVTIKSGMSDFNIASTLKKAGIITNTSDFLDSVHKMKAESKLRAGKFTLRNDMTHEEIIKILAMLK